MKRIFAIALTLITVLAALTGCMSPQKSSGDEGEQNPSGKRLPIVMTIAETLPSCVAFEYKDEKPYCFYAYDTEGKLYRVFWNDFTGLSEKDVIVVDHNDDIKTLTYDEYPSGWTPQYEVTAISIKPNEMASCVSDEDGTYYLILPQSKDKIKIRDEQRMFVPYISDSLVETAEKKIADDISKYDNNSGFYLQVTEEYLCLTVEVIKQLDEPDESVGCIDHEHLFFSERITLCPVYTESNENDTNNQIDPPVGYPYADRRVWDRNHPDDSERYPHFSITVPELGDALIEHKEDGKVYIDGEVLFGGAGNGCESFYLADVDGDYKPELCFGMNLGSGIVHQYVTIYDYETEKCIFSLSERMLHDYYFFVRNGKLCVKETEYMRQETVRTGTVIYDGSQITVSWDKEVNDNADRDKIPEPVQPVS